MLCPNGPVKLTEHFLVQASIDPDQPARPCNPDLKRLAVAVCQLAQRFFDGSLDLARIFEEEQPARLVPLGKNATAEDELKLSPRGCVDPSGQAGADGLSTSERVIDADFASEGLVIAEPIDTAADGPVFKRYESIQS